METHLLKTPKTNKTSYLGNSIRPFVILFVLLVILICLLPYLFTRPAFCDRLIFSDKGEIGDTISGTMGPFIAIVAAFLTFIAFWIQYKANQQITLQFDQQANDVAIERFENKYYELLRIQRENTTEIEIENYSKDGGVLKGRKAMISMFDELRFCYVMTKKYINNNPTEDFGFDPNNDEAIVDLSYQLFFMGIGENSNKLVIDSLSKQCNKNFISNLIIFLIREVKTKYINYPKGTFKETIGNVQHTYKSKYLPLGGHISRLGHYFRHLYQTVKFIAEQDDKIIDETRKCEYAKTLRAQLSDHEQLLLYYNSISTLGNAWILGENSFIKRFRMIKNMPLPLADFGIPPREKFKKEIEDWHKLGKAFFEWDER